MKAIKEFETIAPWRLLLKYSIPSIVASSVHAIYNIVDRIYIGKALGTDALAGLTITFPIFILSIAIGVLLGNGSSSIISIRLGEKNKEVAEKTLGNTIGLYTILGVIVAVLGSLFIKPLLRIVGADEITMPYAYEYLVWFLPFMAFDFMAMGTNGSIRSEGNPHLAMKIAVSGALINIILDPIFLFVFHLGVKGVAIATVLARIITASCVLWHFTVSKHRYLTLRKKYLIPQWHIVKPMLAIGVSPFSMNLATTLVAVFTNRALIAHGDAVALGALGAIQSIFVMIETPLRGLMMAGQPIIGFNFGAKIYDRVKKTLKVSYLYSLVISIIGFLAVNIFGRFLVSLFSKGDSDLIEIGYSGLRIYMMMIPLVGIHMMTVMYFQAVNKPAKAIFLNLLRKVIIYLPVLMILPRLYGLTGVWATVPVADFISTVTAIGLIYFEVKSQRHLEVAFKKKI